MMEGRTLIATAVLALDFSRLLLDPYAAIIQKNKKMRGLR
jgi:hypothetical protein